MIEKLLDGKVAKYHPEEDKVFVHDRLDDRCEDVVMTFTKEEIEKLYNMFPERKKGLKDYLQAIFPVL